MKQSAPEFYNTVAARYDANYTSVSDRAEDRFVYSVLGPLDDLDVLDVGCGTGAVLEHAGTPRHYVGLDPSPAMLAVARKKFPQRRLVEADDYKVGRMPRRSYDLVVAMWSFSYLNPGAARRIEEVLRPGGRFFGIAYAPRYVRRPAFMYKGVSHDARTWTPSELRAHLHLAGFTSVRVRGLRFIEGDSHMPLAVRTAGMRAASLLVPARLALALMFEASVPDG